jgi:hypothetical protein
VWLVMVTFSGRPTLVREVTSAVSAMCKVVLSASLYRSNAPRRSEEWSVPAFLDIQCMPTSSRLWLAWRFHYHNFFFEANSATKKMLPYQHGDFTL